MNQPLFSNFNVFVLTFLFIVNYSLGQSDAPCGAPVLAVNASCTYTSGTNAGATASPVGAFPAPGCASYSGGDVWYQLTVPAGGSVTIDMNSNGGMTDSGLAIYSGTCTSMTLIECDDDDSPNGLMSMISRSGLTPGATIWVRVWEYGNNNNGTFQICASIPPVVGACSNPANNDYCSNPAILTQGPGSWSSSTSSTYTADNPAGLSFCGSIENNSWYQFTATATTASFPFSNVTNCNQNWGIQAQVFSVTTSGLGCCTGFTSVSNCMNPGVNVNGTVNATGLTIGNTYILMVDGWGGDQCDFTVAGWTATGILPVEMVSLKAIGMDAGNIISWQSLSEINNDYFEILKSSNGIDFQPIGRVNGNGNSNETINYEFFDSNKRIGTSYYKIRQYDFDGKNKTSEMVAVERISNEEGIIAAYPNPTNNTITVEIKSTDKINGIIEITNASGRTMMSEIVFGNDILIQSFDVSQFDNGLYFIKYKDDHLNSTKKFTKL